jgi:hypothetical protein
MSTHEVNGLEKQLEETQKEVIDNPSHDSDSDSMKESDLKALPRRITGKSLVVVVVPYESESRRQHDAIEEKEYKSG